MEDIHCERNAEFERQRKKDILKGDYVRLEILISRENPDLPYAHFVKNKCSEKDVAYLLSAMKLMYKDLSNKFPMAEMYSNIFLSAKKNQEEQ